MHWLKLPSGNYVNLASVERVTPFADGTVVLQWPSSTYEQRETHYRDTDGTAITEALDRQAIKAVFAPKE